MGILKIGKTLGVGDQRGSARHRSDLTPWQSASVQ
jgi:hypothetical protein